jgi:hypothetical protein
MARKKKAQGEPDSGETQPFPAVHVYQEGSVESVGEAPTGTDDTDRSGDGTLPAQSKSKPEGTRDAFVSSDVAEQNSVPGKDPRTRS